MNKLITKILTDGKGSHLTRINPKLLSEMEQKQVVWINEYIMKYGSYPALPRFKSEFKFFIEEPSLDPTDDIFERLLVERRNTYFRSFINAHIKEINDGKDPSEYVAELAKIFAAASDNVIDTSTFNRTSYFSERDIWPWGIDLLDRSTGGIASGDIVWFVGRPGSGKTTFMESLLVDWTFRGLRILYISNENPAYECIPKIDAMYGGWNPLKWRTGDWTDEDRAKIAAVQYLTSSLSGKIIIPENPALSTTQVLSFIETYEPDIVAIDGVYLMSDTGSARNDWQDAAAVSRNLKRMARTRQLPIIGVIQANREAEGTQVTRATIAHTDAYLQDADTIIGINRGDDGKTATGQVVKSRWGATPLSDFFDIAIDFNTMKVSTSKRTTVEITDEEW